MSKPLPGAYGADLLPQHAALLAESVIAPEVAAARGYRTVGTQAELKRLGFAASQCRVPALLLPIWNVHGEIANYQIRPDAPRVVDGKALKYETPRGSRLLVDVPPAVRPALGGPDGPLFITEGARKADAAVSTGLDCIDLMGVWGWRGSNERGGLTALADWDMVAFKAANGRAREINLAFDSDIMTKRPVYAALGRLKKMAEGRGGRVRIAYLPSGPGGTKVGLDDFFAAGATVDDLLGLIEDDLRPPPASDEPSKTYFTTQAGTFWNKPTGEGVIPVHLANFSAEIKADILEDDGVETERHFEIAATVGEAVTRFRLPAAKFASLMWPTEFLGHKAILFPGHMQKEHLRVAVLTGSDDVAEYRVFRHTGWREVGGEMVYLHSEGAIGAAGLISEVQVRLPDQLGRYALPKPPGGADLVAAAAAELQLVELGPANVIVPIVGAAFHAALGGSDFSIHVSGRSGAFKSELSALVQQHFGSGMNRLHLPTNWSATENAIEDLAFSAKDSVLTIDDFAPTGTSRQINGLHAKADRVLRAAGNRSARQRMRSDTSLRAPRPPRGVMISTGEDVPRGQSLRARTLILELAHGDIAPARLRQCQTDAAAGRYAGVMSAFIRWLATRVQRLQAGLRQEVERLRDLALHQRQHRRTPEIVANLAVGWACFLVFLHDCGVLTRKQVLDLWRRVWEALGEAADAQRKHQAAAEPVSRFIHLIHGAIAGGLAHIADRSGEPAYPLSRWGWVPGYGDEGAPRGQGTLIGWVDGDDVYLEPEAAFAVAQRMAREQGEPLAISLEMLCRLLHERKLLLSVEQTGNETRYRVRRVLGESRRRALHVATGLVSPVESPGHPGHDDENAAAERFGWTGPGTGGGPAPGHRPGHAGPPSLWPLLGFEGDGPDGPEEPGEGAAPDETGGDARGQVEMDL